MALRILSIFGTRPEAVKMAPVVQMLAKTPSIESFVCVTAQHRQMLDQVLDLFHLHPDIDLDLMRPDQSLAELTASIFSRLDPVLDSFRPDWVLVQGDTTTAMSASLLAFYHRLRVGHVEAGLRTANKWQPFPEEINRRVVSVVADLHFAPTESARQHLLSEGVSQDQVVVTGNSVIDALQTVAHLPLTAEVRSFLASLGILEELSSPAPRLVLVTAHRRENFGQGLLDICTAIRTLAELYQGRVRFIYPVHMNPNVQEPAYRLLEGISNIILLPPLDYLPWIHLLKRATLLLTDSGGLQEEAPSLGVPVLALRRTTERPEGITAGTVRLVGTDPDRIISETCRLLDDPQAHAQMAQAVNPYGDGHASERIVQSILKYSSVK